MKKILMAVFAAFMLISCSNTQEYKVAVLFPDATSDGQTAYLTSYDSGDTLAQGEIKNKNVVLQGEVEGSFMARLVVDGKRMGFIVEGGEIAIKWEEGKATGTALNEKLNALDEQLGKIEDEQAQAEAFQKAYLENKDNGIGSWAFNYYLMYGDYTVAQIDSMLTALPASYRDLKRVNKAISDAKAKEATAVGKQFTDFANAKGEKLSDHAGNGKYTLVDFWASWCGPCRKEVANIKQLYAKYNEKMNFVGIAVWDEDDATVKAMEELKIEWPVIMNGKNWSEPTDLYGIAGIPHIMLIDPAGKIVARGLGGDELIKTVDDLFVEK